MALRTIVKDGDPILKKVCRPVTKFDDRLATLLDDMQDTLVDADGLGLAGPQVGMMRRIFLSDETNELYEGCLSFPGHNGAITRSKNVKVKAQDRNGNWFELEAENMLARCIQHENDHLNGVTIMDRATHFYEDDYPEDAED